MYITTQPIRDGDGRRFGYTLIVDLSPRETPRYAQLLEQVSTAGVDATAAMLNEIFAPELARLGVRHAAQLPLDSLGGA